MATSLATALQRQYQQVPPLTAASDPAAREIVVAAPRRPGAPEVVRISAPIAAKTAIDLDAAAFYTDALAACSENVPRLAGFDADFCAELDNLRKTAASSDAAEMLRIYKYTSSRLLYGSFDGDNPGHVLIATQCFSSIWAGVAAQCFAAVLLRRCVAATASAAGTAQAMQPLDLVIAVLASTAKSFGSSMRISPLVPRWPDCCGTPPDPVVILADAIIARHSDKFPFADRADLLDALRTWHVPRCARDTLPDWRRTWVAQRQYDRAHAMMQMQLNALSLNP